jgi:hypothetical protein
LADHGAGRKVGGTVTGMPTRERPYDVQGSYMPKDLCQNRRDGVNQAQFASLSSLNLCAASAADSPERDRSSTGHFGG